MKKHNIRVPKTSALKFNAKRVCKIILENQAELAKQIYELRGEIRRIIEEEIEGFERKYSFF